MMDPFLPPSSSPLSSPSPNTTSANDHTPPNLRSNSLARNSTPVLPSPPVAESVSFSPPSASPLTFPFRPRGHTTSTLRKSYPLPEPISRVTSDPTPSGIDQLSFSSFRDNSLSPPEDHRELWFLSGKHRPETPPHGTPSSWWSRTEIVPRPWKESPRRKKTIPSEQTEAWLQTRNRVASAVVSVLGQAGDVAHEALLLSVDALRFAPVIGLAEAARTLLNIWDALQLVDMNRLACLRLTERCADILMSVREEIADAGDDVGEELRHPLSKLVESFTQVHVFLQKQVHRPFIKRYLRRDEILQQIAQCDINLRESLEMFSISIQIRILKQVQNAELRRQAETQALLSSLIGSGSAIRDGHQSQSLLLSGEGLPPSPEPKPLPPLPFSLTTPSTTDITVPTSPQTTSPTDVSPVASTTLSATFPIIPIPTTIPTTPHEIRHHLRTLHALQNEIDLVRDTADLRQLMRVALGTSSDAEMIEVLQVGREEMPEAIKTLQRALEKEVGSGGGSDGRKASVSTQVQTQVQGGVSAGGDAAGGGGGEGAVGLERRGTIESRDSGGSGSGKDTLDREFLENGIDVLRRMSKGAESLPSWTITRYEVDREEKIGIGFFSDVYRGTWRNHTVAIKVLAPATPPNVFVREVEIWKTLSHVNVLGLYGASSAAGEPPWFFVSPYYKHGSLVKYLKGLVAANNRGGGSSRNRSEGGRSRSAGRSENDREVDGVDMLKMMYEVAKGMEYLHGKGVLHGDLKGSNVLVDDKLRCVIADFGQSELRSEAYRLSGTVPPPYGTLRWQAPELITGQSQLTTEMDVYAYAICCIEILSMGSFSWLQLDDETIKRFVLTDNARPLIPKTRVSSVALTDLLRICWHRDPLKRPPFSRIVREVKSLRLRVGTPGASVDVDEGGTISPRIGRMGSEMGGGARESPDMRPMPLMLSPTGAGATSPALSSPMVLSAGSSDGSYKTAVGDSEPSSHEPYVPEGHIQTLTAQPVYFTPSGDPSQASSIFTIPEETPSGSGSDEGLIGLQHSGYESPPPVNEWTAELRSERRYRMLLTHEFHPSLTLPLWTPTLVCLGDVGYLTKPSGTFVTLFSAFNPAGSSEGAIKGMPPVSEYGNMMQGQQKQDKRNIAQKGFDAISGFLTFRSKGNGPISQNVSRRYSFPLRAGHRAAYLCTEATAYNYIENLEAPKKWFKANVDKILKVYGAKHALQKEDLYLVIGTLNALDYAFFVSHQHPDGQVHFNVFSSQKTDQNWGMFTTDTEFPPERGGPSYHEEVPGYDDRSSASKVSVIGGGKRTLLVAKLRFKPDVLEPTSL